MKAVLERYRNRISTTLPPHAMQRTRVDRSLAIRNSERRPHRVQPHSRLRSGFCFFGGGGGRRAFLGRPRRARRGAPAGDHNPGVRSPNRRSANQSAQQHARR